MGPGQNMASLASLSRLSVATEQTGDCVCVWQGTIKLRDDAFRAAFSFPLQRDYSARKTSRPVFVISPFL